MTDIELIPPWVKHLVAALLMISVVAAIYFYGERQFTLGEHTERALCLERDNTQLTAANQKIKSLEESYRQQEQDNAHALSAISQTYQKDLSHVKAEKDRVIAGLRDGSVRLSVPVTPGSTADGSPPAAVSTSASGCDANARAELSGQVAEFLVSFAADADEVTRQLGRCQDIVRADRNQGVNHE